MRLHQNDEITAHLARLDSALDESARALNAAILHFNEAYRLFWEGDDAEIKERLDRLGPAAVQQAFQKHEEGALLLNAAAALHERPDLLRERAIVGAARKVEWDGEQFQVEPLDADPQE